MGDIPGKKRNDPTEVVHTSQSISWQGPLPPPGALEQYERCLPGAMDRILTMAEKEGEHRRSIDEKIIEEETNSRKAFNAISRRGQWFGFGVVIISFSSAVVCSYIGATVPASLCVGTTIVGLGGTFLGQHKPTKHREKA